MTAFIKGLQLSHLFFDEAVRPILSTHFPQLSYSAGRLDFGSDVLGFDTPMSRDHHWGPRVVLFLREEDIETYRMPIVRCLSRHLPKEIHGYPTHFNGLETHSGVMQAVKDGPVTPYVPVTTLERFLLGYAGVEITHMISAVEWLTIPWQRLATISSGKVFHDGLGTLKEWQERLRWYPHDLWLYILAVQWNKIDQEEPFMARCGDVGDDLGSRDVAARMLHCLMNLCFLMEKRYPPYSKWFGTAFSKLNCAPELLPIFARIHQSSDWKEREQHLSSAYLHIGKNHNCLNLTAEIAPEISNFHDRPYQVPHAGRYADALREMIRSEEVRSLPPHLGSIDQFVENVDLLESIVLCRRLKMLYHTPLESDLPDPCPVVTTEILSEKEEKA